MDDPLKSIIDLLRGYATGTLTGPDLERWFVGNGSLEKHFQPERWARILAMKGDEQGRTIWNELRRWLGSAFPSAQFRDRARWICRGVLDGSVDPVVGVREMRDLRFEFEDTPAGQIPWAELAARVENVPTRDQYPHWDAAALERHTAPLRACAGEIEAAAREFLSLLD